MSTSEKMPDKRQCGNDAAAYVLGALEPEELEAFRAHLASCAACREDVAALQPVVEALPAAAPQLAAPGDLRRRVIDAARSEPKDAGPAPEEPDQRGRPAPRPRARRRWGWAPSPAAAVAGVLAAALVAVGIVELASGGSSGTRVIQASVRGTGSAELRVTGRRGELVVSHFPPPPSGQIYQVWLERGHAAPSPTSTLFSVTSTGTGDIGLVGDLRGVSEVLVTAEPSGGTLVPTTAPLITAQIS
ncbi:MAG: anti-sigma factor [Solirubrobacterales bacterium]|nr:anti-sigma factor [Solirubrobacterales bacterium]